MALVEERVARLEAQTEEQNRRINNIDELISGVARIAFGLDNVQLVIGRIETKLDAVETRITLVENKPGQLGIKAWMYIASAFGGGLIAWGIKQILSLVGVN